MVTLVNRAKMSTATLGTGTITLGLAESGYQSFAAAGVTNGQTVRYVIEDGTAWEIGSGVYAASGTTLTRTVSESSNAGSAITLTGAAVVYVTTIGSDIVQPSSLATVATTGAYSDLSGTPTIPAAYTNTDVDAHLNTGTAASSEVLSWTGTDYDWVTVAAGATSINGLSDGYSDGSSVGLGAGSLANDDGTANINLAVGINAGTSLTSGSQNIAIGNGALSTSTTSVNNIAIGHDAMRNSSAVGNTRNIAIGGEAGKELTTGNQNVLLGHSAGLSLTTGLSNIVIGLRALDATLTGGRNIAIGLDTMGVGAATATAGDNVALGYQAGNNITTALQNILVGSGAGKLITTGQQNTCIGGEGTGGTITTGSNNIVLGRSAQASSATVSNEITLGNSSITRFRIPAAGIDNTSEALSGLTPSVDTGARDTYTLSTTGNTTFTLTGAPSSGQVGTFSLIITAGGAHTLTWPASVKWAGGTAPAAPASGATDVYTFTTINAGTTWYGFLAGGAMA